MGTAGTERSAGARDVSTAAHLTSAGRGLLHLHT